MVCLAICLFSVCGLGVQFVFGIAFMFVFLLRGCFVVGCRFRCWYLCFIVVLVSWLLLGLGLLAFGSG